MSKRYQSMEEMLMRKSLFVRDIDSRVSKLVVKSDLEPVCPKELGQICVPVDTVTQTTNGTAYCNFHSASDATDALQRYRFKLKVGGRPASISYSVSSKDRAKIMGTWGYRLSIIVKNLSPDVTIEMFCDKFEVFGEIFRCKVATAENGMTYGLAQYINENSVYEALRRADKTPWLSSMIVVERHEKMAAQDNIYGAHMANRYGSSEQPSIPSTPLPSLRPAPSTPRDNAVIAESSFSDTKHTPSTFPHPKPTQRTLSPWPSPRPDNRIVPSVLSRTISDGTSSAQDVQYPPYRTNVANAGQLAVSPVPAGNGSIDVRANSQESENGDRYNTWNAVDIYDVFDKRRQMHQEDQKVYSYVQSPDAAPSSPIHNAVKPKGVEKIRRLRDAVKDLEAIVDRWTGGLTDCVGLLCCPITHELFRDPVLASDGNTYEREAIQEWFSKRSTSPLTNVELRDKTLTPNHLVKKIVQEVA